MLAVLGSRAHLCLAQGKEAVRHGLVSHFSLHLLSFAFLFFLFFLSCFPKKSCCENEPTPDFQRGPAKGYVEALEHRLAATEAALLQLYSVVDERLLEAAFQDSEAYMAQRSGGEGGGGGGAYAGNGVARQAEHKRADDNLAQWECFPLLTAADVKHWAENNLQRPPQRAPVVIVGGTAGGAGGGGSLRPVTLPLDTANARKDYEREMQEERRRTSTTSVTSSSGGGDDDDGQVHHLSHRDVFSMTQEFKSQYLW